MGYKYAYPTYNSLITTHEPPGRALAEAKRVSKSWPERLLCVGTAFEDLGLERRGFLLIMLGLGGIFTTIILNPILIIKATIVD